VFKKRNWFAKYRLKIPTNVGGVVEDSFCRMHVAGQGQLEQAPDPARELGRADGLKQ
jgi:hypothetical protein